MSCMLLYVIDMFHILLSGDSLRDLWSAYMYICMYVCIYVFMYVCKYVCMYVCVYLCMYICMYEQLQIFRLLGDITETTTVHKYKPFG